MRLRGDMIGHLEMVSIRLKRRHSLRALVLGAFLCALPITAAFAQTSVNAGDTSALAGTTAAVPISIVLPAGTTCATLQFNLTVVANGGAPAVSSNVTFASLVGPPSANLNNGPATVLVGWFSNFSPLLTLTVQLGTLSVPIPASATGGQTYTVEVLNPSGTTDGLTDLGNIDSVNGTITVGGGPTASVTPTVPPTNTPTNTSTVPPTNTPTNTPTVVPPTSTPTGTATRTPTSSPSVTATATSTSTGTPLPTSTPTATSTPTRTQTPTATPTNTPTATNTPLPTSTSTSTATTTATRTPTATGTTTATPTPSSISTPTSTPLAPELSVVPPSPHNFGSVVAGQSVTFTYTVQNTGGAPLTGSAATACAGFDVQPTSLNVPANGQVILTVTFMPSTVGSYSCDLVLLTNGGDASLALGGNGVALPPIPDVNPWGAGVLAAVLLIALVLRSRLVRAA